MSADAFISWMIARYLQSDSYLQGYKELYKGMPDEDIRDKMDDERLYLRVHFVVSRRWPREPLKFEERQIAVLDQISDVLTDNP